MSDIPTQPPSEEDTTVPPNWVRVRVNGTTDTYVDVTSYTEIKDENGAVVQVTFFGTLEGAEEGTAYHIIGVGAGTRVSSRTVA